MENFRRALRDNWTIQVLISIVGNLREFQEFHCIQSCSSQYTSMTASTILAGIINNNRKCPIIMEFYNGSLQEFVGQDPNHSVYLAPIEWDITRYSRFNTQNLLLVLVS